MLSDMLHLYL